MGLPTDLQDSWAVFPTARNMLFNALRTDRIDGVVLLSGDVHRAEFRLINPGGFGDYSLPELTSSPLANTNFGCGNDSELRACHDTNNYFITVDVDTTIADPELTATIFNGAGTSLNRWTMRLSELSNP